MRFCFVAITCLLLLGSCTRKLCKVPKNQAQGVATTCPLEVFYKHNPKVDIPAFHSKYCDKGEIVQTFSHSRGILDEYLAKKDVDLGDYGKSTYRLELLSQGFIVHETLQEVEDEEFGTTETIHVYDATFEMKGVLTVGERALYIDADESWSWGEERTFFGSILHDHIFKRREKKIVRSVIKQFGKKVLKELRKEIKSKNKALPTKTK